VAPQDEQEDSMISMRLVSRASAIAALAGLSLPLFAQTLPNGVAAGDTTQTSSVLWARPAVAGDVTFEYSTDESFTSGVLSASVNVADATVPAKTQVSGLSAGTRYYYRATDASGNRSSGTFKTNAAAGTRTGFRMGVSGDWRGELAPYPAIRNMAAKKLDVFVALGDTIYGDVKSNAIPASQAQSIEEYRAKHNEVYSSRFGLNTLADLRASTSTLAMIDDHEVTNDFAGYDLASNDARFSYGNPAAGTRVNKTDLYNNGIQAFREYNPTANENYAAIGDDRTDGVAKLARSRTFGQDAAVFTLDARSFRDKGLPAANPLDQASVGGYLVQAFDPSRTMTSKRQLNDLKADLLAAQQNGVTWKFVNTPEPIQNLGVVGASDRFEGYAAERTELLSFIKNNNIQNVVFIAADIHGTLVNNLTYQNGPFQPQIDAGCFEITTGSVAYDAPFGPTVAGLAFQLGLPGAISPAVYASLSPAQQEGYVQTLVNAQITPLGYDPIGLQGSSIPATLLQGSYSATNTFGWTEFDVNKDTLALTVTTWGVPSYTEAQLLANPDLITALQPQIVSQFVVQAVPTPGALGLLGVTVLGASRRRRLA
jgi:alkaline phosphatase D